MNTAYTLTVTDTLDGVDAAVWQAMARGSPFVGYHFLRLLQATGCVHARQGWYPQYALLHQGGVLVGAAPCFLKTHSRGEFVFDQGWAQAFAAHGLPYYPKLVIASPFTPVQGPRLLAVDAQARLALAQGLRQFCEQSQASSVHSLFVNPEDRLALQRAGFMVREGVQFHWRNEAYDSTESFLAQLSQDKRKKMRQDSKYVAAAGISYRWLEGEQLTPEHLSFFYRCYVQTYVEHHSQPYLSEDFFQQAHAQGVLHFVLVLAERDKQPVACALNARAADTLYGRYWGSQEFVRGLHFETCYMQSIAYCIAHQLQIFEGGAQGEYKMARGLLPVSTYSAHYVAHPQFAQAIGDFLEQETMAVEGYVQELQAGNPFKPK
ncbi:GNAT family N-acetyltransferase [Comamonas sp.]|uniref:GNAT family N-acetyltransferase n=1 Tax=Comamonas sp. TaxID=34028 RepID=UPI002583D3FB|nr:GNAT family N-acetyltransferase [Comamonas sp.]